MAFDYFGTLANQSAPKKIRPWDFGSQGVKKMSNAIEAPKTVKTHKKTASGSCLVCLKSLRAPRISEKNSHEAQFDT